MKKQIIAGLFISILLAPIASFADSYDGPYCYEDLKNWEKYAAPDKNSQKYKDAEQWQKDAYDMDRERDEVRGTADKLP